MKRRPSDRLQVGDIDSTIAYEQRGSEWVLFRYVEGEAPGTRDQAYFSSVIKCHEAFIKACHERLDGAESLHAPPADEGTRRAITTFLDDIPQMGQSSE